MPEKGGVHQSYETGELLALSIRRMPLAFHFFHPSNHTHLRCGGCQGGWNEFERERVGAWQGLQNAMFYLRTLLLAWKRFRRLGSTQLLCGETKSDFVGARDGLQASATPRKNGPKASGEGSCCREGVPSLCGFWVGSAQEKRCGLSGSCTGGVCGFCLSSRWGLR